MSAESPFSSFCASARVRGVGLLLGELDQHVEVVHAAAQRSDPIDLGLQARQPRRDPLGVLLVVPQVGRGHLLLEVGDLDPLGVGVDHGLDGVEGPIEDGQVGLQVSGGHEGSLYRDRLRSPAPRIRRSEALPAPW